MIENNGGDIVKFEADNCFASFPDVYSAVKAAIALNAAFAGMNLLTQDESDIHVSIGIDFGEVLLIGGPDYFGDPVNCASKLGEDIGGPGQILITSRAFQQIPEGAQITGQPARFSISGIELDVFSICY